MSMHYDHPMKKKHARILVEEAGFSEPHAVAIVRMLDFPPKHVFLRELVEAGIAYRQAEAIASYGDHIVVSDKD